MPGSMVNTVPGIDLAGVVEESASAEFAVGDAVVVTGCGLSEKYWGGYAEVARIPDYFADGDGKVSFVRRLS